MTWFFMRLIHAIHSNYLYIEANIDLSDDSVMKTQWIHVSWLYGKVYILQILFYFIGLFCIWKRIYFKGISAVCSTLGIGYETLFFVIEKRLFEQKNIEKLFVELYLWIGNLLKALECSQCWTFLISFYGFNQFSSLPMNLIETHKKGEPYQMKRSKTFNQNNHVSMQAICGNESVKKTILSMKSDKSSFSWYWNKLFILWLSYDAAVKIHSVIHSLILFYLKYKVVLSCTLRNKTSIFIHNNST